MEIPIWALIPAILLLTGFYWVLGNNGIWNYTTQDFIYGNLIVAGGVGFVYLGIEIYKHYNIKL